jgi:nucleoside-diphosphate-sugar epimerase
VNEYKLLGKIPMRVFIIGGNGQIGYELCTLLKGAGIITLPHRQAFFADKNSTQSCYYFVYLLACQE